MLQARPAFVAAVVLTFAAAALLLLVAAGGAQAAIWVIPGTARVFPSTQPTASKTSAPQIKIDAAGNEYEGSQVVLRGGGSHRVTFTWGAGSDPLIVANTTLDEVYYVYIAHPTTGLHAHAGLYPDPLVPKGFSTAITVPGRTTSFYLLTHVPYGTPAGDYHATLVVQNGGAADTCVRACLRAADLE